MPDITLILSAIEQGDAQAASQLLPAVYQELRRLARHHMMNERAEHTLQATAFVHEAYVRLAAGEGGWTGRAHFYAAASEAMRRILIDHARRKQALCRGGDLVRMTLDDAQDVAISASGVSAEELLDIDAALEDLAAANPAWAELVKLVFFAGLSLDEAAEIQGISRATAYRTWTLAKAWLHHVVRGHAADS